MSEIRFHASLYPDTALDEAIALYGKHAEISRTKDGDHVVVRVESPRPGRGERVARELGNYALGLTIQTRGGTIQARGGTAR